MQIYQKEFMIFANFDISAGRKAGTKKQSLVPETLYIKYVTAFLRCRCRVANFMSCKRRYFFFILPSVGVGGVIMIAPDIHRPLGTSR